MKKLHWLIFRSFVGPFLVVFFIVLFVLLMQFMWRYIDEFVGKGLDFLVIGEFLLYTTATLVPMALPLAILMSSLMTFGNLGERYELTAIKASGISLQRIMSPMIFLMVGISIGAFFFANEVLPYSTLKMYSLLNDIKQKRPAFQIKAGEFYNGIEGYSILVSEKDPETQVMYNIKIYNQSEGRGNVSVTIADSAKMQVTADQNNLVFTLYNGYSYNEMEEEKTGTRRTFPHRYDLFGKQEIVLSLTGFDLKRSDNNLFHDHQAMLDLKQLRLQHDTMALDVKKRYQELHQSIVNGPYLRLRTPNSGSPSHKKPTKTIQADISQNDSLSSESNNLIASNTEETFETDTLEYGIDSLLHIMPIKKQKRILEVAIQNARHAKNLIVNTQSTSDYKIRRMRKFEIEEHRKFVLSVACLVFLFIGAPLGAIIRKGGLGLPLVLSTLFFIFYYILSLTGEKMVRESILPAPFGMWFTTAALFLIGFFLTYKATTDSSMLNMDTYTNFLKKIFGQRMRLIDVLLKEMSDITPKQAKVSSQQQSLRSFIETIDDHIETCQQQLKPVGFVLSLVGIQTSSNLLIFERLYKNNIRSIIQSDLYHIRMIRSKLQEFPNFKFKTFLDYKERLIIKLVLLFLFPVTILVILRHYILILTLRNRLVNIKERSKELLSLIDKNE